MTTPSTSSAGASWLGLTPGWSYTLAAFTLTITGCLPLALLLTMHVDPAQGARAQALLTMLVVMALTLALGCVAFYGLVLRQRPHWMRHALMVMWALSALGMIGWWKL